MLFSRGTLSVGCIAVSLGTLGCIAGERIVVSTLVSFREIEKAVDCGHWWQIREFRSCS